nr:MAG TPA: hypothetical protein [Caudoviricetes sp.]
MFDFCLGHSLNAGNTKIVFQSISSQVEIFNGFNDYLFVKTE